MENHVFDGVSVVRMLLLFLHLLTMLAAAIGIAFGDYAIFARQRIDSVLLRKASTLVTAALCGLWFTGLAIIWIDTQFQWAVLNAQPKLLTKLTVVVLLSLNGVALHCMAFKRLCATSDDASCSAWLPAMLGGISAVTWLYAAFLGLAKPLAVVLGYAGFMLLYGAALGAGITLALWLIRPRLADRMAENVKLARPEVQQLVA